MPPRWPGYSGAAFISFCLTMAATALASSVRAYGISAALYGTEYTYAGTIVLPVGRNHHAQASLSHCLVGPSCLVLLHAPLAVRVRRRLLGTKHFVHAKASQLLAGISVVPEPFINKVAEAMSEAPRGRKG